MLSRQILCGWLLAMCGSLAFATVVLSHAAWTRRFGMDPGVLGRSLEIDGRPLAGAHS